MGGRLTPGTPSGPPDAHSHCEVRRQPLAEVRKALVAEANGDVTVTYNDPDYLRERHGVPVDLIKNLAGAGALIAKAVE